MKKIAFILAVLLTFSLVSCGGKKQTVRVEINNEDKPRVVEVDELEEFEILGVPDETEVDYLYDIEGFWVRPTDFAFSEGYALSSVTGMHIVSDDFSWTPYYDGVAGQALKCTADLDGVHFYGVEGDLICTLASTGESLLGNGGRVQFVRARESE